jgi:adenosylcobyric acid synthase
MTSGDVSTLLVAGTASHVGKSTIVAGLCRLLADRGVDVAPFKAQNMSNNAQAVPVAEAVMDEQPATSVGATEDRPSGRTAFGEIGVSQYVQARAAGVAPTTDHNPVLLKPRGNAESQLVLDGQSVDHYAAEEYYDEHWDRARETARDAYERLARAHDMVVAEGAGSIAEINFHDSDLANVETARFGDAEILLAVDIERGGAFASLLGTIELIPADLRDRVTGAVITKFRGDRSLLEPGIESIEARTGVPVVGVIPYEEPGLPEEDSLTLPGPEEPLVRGADDGVSDERAVHIAVPRLPRISNFTDLHPLAAEPGVRVEYRPLSATYSDPDAIVLPGTKNTVDDLSALRRAGLDEKLRSFDGPIVGLCGGYQLLGERIRNASIESARADPDGSVRTADGVVVEGIGLLPVETTFSSDKAVERRCCWLSGGGPFEDVDCRVEGYEIHMGETHPVAPVNRPIAPRRDEQGSVALGAADGNVFGTYLHGLFEREAVRDALLTALDSDSGIREGDSTLSPYDRTASLIGGALDEDWLAAFIPRYTDVIFT